MCVCSETSEKLIEENKKLQRQFLEKKQQLDELTEHLNFYSRVSFHTEYMVPPCVCVSVCGALKHTHVHTHSLGTYLHVNVWQEHIC